MFDDDGPDLGDFLDGGDDGPGLDPRVIGTIVFILVLVIVAILIDEWIGWIPENTTINFLKGLWEIISWFF